MIEAPSFDNVKKHKELFPGVLCCIAFVPKFHKIGYNDTIERFGYLNCRSGMHIYFYCAGYGACWNKEYAPDMELVDVHSDMPWAFSQTFFAKFVDDVEKETMWRYNGGAEFIVLNSNMDFSASLIFNLDKMLSDHVIDSFGEFLEFLIHYAKGVREGIGIDKKKKLQIMFDGVVELLPEKIRDCFKSLRRGRHYLIKDISSSFVS